MEKQLEIGFEKKRVSVVTRSNILTWARECLTREVRPTLKVAIKEVSKAVGTRVNSRTLRCIMRELGVDMDTWFTREVVDPKKQSPVSAMHNRVTALLGKMAALEARVEALEKGRV